MGDLEDRGESGGRGAMGESGGVSAVRVGRAVRQIGDLEEGG